MVVVVVEIVVVMVLLVAMVQMVLVVVVVLSRGRRNKSSGGADGRFGHAYFTRLSREVIEHRGKGARLDSVNRKATYCGSRKGGKGKR